MLPSDYVQKPDFAQVQHREMRRIAHSASPQLSTNGYQQQLPHMQLKDQIRTMSPSGYAPKSDFGVGPHLGRYSETKPVHNLDLGFPGTSNSHRSGAYPVSSSKNVDHGVPTAASVDRMWNAGTIFGLTHPNSFGMLNTMTLVLIKLLND
jgi:hypothetical protein